MQPRDRSSDPKRGAKEMTKTYVKRSIVGFIKAGQIVAISFLLLRFIEILRFGKSLWVEPVTTMLIFEIVLSASLLIGSLYEVYQVIKHAQK